MSLSQLITDINRLGITIERIGPNLGFSPKSCVTPKLREQLKHHKAELLDLLDLHDGGPLEVDQLEEDGYLGDVAEAELDDDGWPVGSIAFSDVEPCPKCNRYDLWQSWRGEWQCQNCNPPTPLDRESP